MKAARIHDYGPIDQLRVEEAPMPVLGPNDVLIRAVAASVNPVDWKIRRGYLAQMIPYKMPLILGWDVAGVVEGIGTAVTKVAKGDTVYSRPDIRRSGTYAEYVAVDEDEVALKPATISFVEAASLPLVSITAWESLFTAGQMQPGQRVLIHAGAGGVGSIAIQLAKARGAHVTATASAGKAALVRSLGADEVIDYRDPTAFAAARDLDLVFDTVGGATQDASWDMLKPGGTLVSIVAPPSKDRAEATGKRAEFVFIDPNAEILSQLSGMVDAGQVRPVIGGEFRLDDIRRAHEASETGRTTGKIVIYTGQP